VNSKLKSAVVDFKLKSK